MFWIEAQHIPDINKSSLFIIREWCYAGIIGCVLTRFGNISLREKITFTDIRKYLEL